MGDFNTNTYHNSVHVNHNLVYRFRNAYCVKRLISIRIIIPLILEASIVTTHTLLETIKASMHACFVFHSQCSIPLTFGSIPLSTFHISVYVFQLSSSNKLSKVKIVSVLNYTKINHYMITLVQVFWNLGQVS